MNISQQISWTLYLTKKTKSTVLRTQTVYTNPPYHLHTHPWIPPQDLLAHRNVSHLLFTGLHNPGWKRTDLPTCGRLVELSADFFFFPGFEIKQTAQPIPEERRYRQTKRTSGGAGVHKKNRTEPTPMWISLTESLTTTVPWLLHRTVSPPVGRGAKREEDTLSLKQKKSQLLWSLTNGGHPSTVQYHIS